MKTNHLFVLVIEIGTIKISSDTDRLSDMPTDIVILQRYFYRIGVNVKTIYLKPHNFTSTDTDTDTDTDNIGECEYALMQYIIQQKDNETKSKEDEKNLDVNDKFFSSMCSMVKQFSPYHQHVARSKIFSIISELELQHITQQSCNRPQNTPNPQCISYTNT